MNVLKSIALIAATALIPAFGFAQGAAPATGTGASQIGQSD